MRGLPVIALVGLLGGCTSVRLSQRDGCWVRRTEQWPGQVKEELGPCARPQPAWAEDRHTRLLQECVAEADYRWQSHALAAWDRGEPLPPPESEQSVLQACMNDASAAMVNENEALRERVIEAKGELEALRANLEETRAYLRSNHQQLAEYLGEAAKKPAGTATASATSTSDGKARTENDTSLAATPAMALDGPPVRISRPSPKKSSPPRGEDPNCPIPAPPGPSETTAATSPPKGK